MSPVTQAKTSPLHLVHEAAGGRMVPFAGWKLPVRYGSILEEARAVRNAAGMFDVSHMARTIVRGPDAMEVLQGLGTNDLSRIEPGKAQYTLWCTPDGGTIDDLIVFWMGGGVGSSSDDFLVVMNASRRDDDLEHLGSSASGREVTIVDETEETAMLAVQGPTAREIVASLGASGVETMPRFGVVRTTVAGVGVTLSRTGYTGEDGVELICDAGAGPRLFESLREAGVMPAGLGARDALRMEMGYPLYGHELSLDTSPLEAGVSFAVDLDEGREFIGRDALVKQAEDGPPRTLVGFTCETPAVPMQGDAIGDGVVTSGGTSVVLGGPIGLAFVPTGTQLGSTTLHTRGKQIPCTFRKLPLIGKKSRKKAS
ncbi:MAG: glycine cleavage system aminomethyltransferase GcvT [Actinomycetota bacterium]